MVNKIIPKLKMKDWSLKIVTIVFAALLVMFGLTTIGVFDVSNYVLPVIKIASVIILFIEISMFAFISQVIKSRGKNWNFLTSIEAIVGILVLIETFLSLGHVSFPAISILSGWIMIIFGAVFTWEAFAR